MIKEFSVSIWQGAGYIYITVHAMDAQQAFQTAQALFPNADSYTVETNHYGENWNADSN